MPLNRPSDLDATGEAETERAWLEEAERRLAEIENGTAKTIPGRQVLDEAYARLK